jgi:hypothetical protein
VEAIGHTSEDEAVVAAEALSAADGPKQQQWQQIAFGKSAAARTKSHVATAVTAMIWLEKRRMGGGTHASPQKFDLRRGRKSIGVIVHHEKKSASRRGLGICGQSFLCMKMQAHQEDHPWRIRQAASFPHGQWRSIARSENLAFGGAAPSALRYSTESNDGLQPLRCPEWRLPRTTPDAVATS